MFKELLIEFLRTRARENIVVLDKSTGTLLMDFANWLDTRGLTLRVLPSDAVELLVHIKEKVLTDENYDADDMVREINAVLKTACGE